MPEWIKVYLSKEQRRLPRGIAEGLGIWESEVLRQAFMEYAKSMGPHDVNNAQNKNSHDHFGDPTCLCAFLYA